MTAKKSTKKVSDGDVIALYMDYVLEHGFVPKSIYKFCKENSIEEKEFYSHFGSIEGLQKVIWSKFYENTLKAIKKSKEFTSFSNRDKLLTFYFTFFELITLNRSYVLFALGENRNMLKNLEQLKGLRRDIKGFTSELIQEANADKSLKLTQYNPKIFSEGAWLQFLFLLKFWMDDSSAGFEKTDIAIEKSVNTVFDVFDNTPLDRILDLGKFLYKENFA